MSFARSGGPGGQHVNKTESKVVLRWNALASPALSEQDRELLEQRLASRLTESGELLVTSERYRDQSRNTDDALQKLIETVRAAIKRPTPRKKSRPTRASKERRLETKRRRGATKRQRRQQGDE